VTIFEGDRFVGHPGFGGIGQVNIVGVTAAKALTPDATLAEDGNIVNAFAPQQTIVPMIVAVVLVGLPWALRFGVVVTSGGGALQVSGCSEDRGALVEIEAHLALQMNRVARVSSSRKINGAATCGRGGVNGTIDCGSIDGLAVAGSAEGLDTENASIDEDFTGKRRSCWHGAV